MEADEALNDATPPLVEEQMPDQVSVCDWIGAY